KASFEQRDETCKIIDLFAIKTEGFGVLPLLELQRQNPHPYKVRAMDALVALGDDGADAQKLGSLGGPVARRAGAVLLASENDQWHAALGVLHAGVEDGHLLAFGDRK